MEQIKADFRILMFPGTRLLEKVLDPAAAVPGSVGDLRGSGRVRVQLGHVNQYRTFVKLRVVSGARDDGLKLLERFECGILEPEGGLQQRATWCGRA